MPHTSRLARVLLTCFATLWVVGACSSTPEHVNPGPPPKTWLLDEVDGNPALEGVHVMLILESAGQIHGHGGVNQFFGSYRIDGSKFHTISLAATRMAGPVDARRQESLLLALIRRADGVEMEDHELLLLEGQRTILKFIEER